MKENKLFSGYEIFVIIILTTLQFTIILDFMVLSPLGAMLMPALSINPTQFALVVSAYAISAGVSGFLAAGFADKFDRKKILLFFYTGFIVGTLLCGLAPDYPSLLVARIVTGIFGGVIGSITFAIATDLFRLEVRGRVMGFIQMAFASSQVLGLPIGLYLATKWNWHFPFLMIVGVSFIVMVLIILYIKPIDAHLKVKSDRNPLLHLFKTATNTFYLKTFVATTLLATGGFMLMPFGTAFGVNNLKLELDMLPMLYMVTGIVSMIAGPMLGKASDTWGKFNVFLIGSLGMTIITVYYTQLGPTPLWIVMILNALMFVGVASRMISSSALISAVPQLTDRGAFMSINSSLQQISGGIASYIAGLIVIQCASGELNNYHILGYIVAGTTVITILMIGYINKMVTSRQSAGSL